MRPKRSLLVNPILSREVVQAGLRSLSRILGVIFLTILTPAVSYADNYEGRESTYLQPDGSSFEVRLFGDEFYAVAETPDGYVITRDPESQFHCYARLSDDGRSFVSTQIQISDPIPTQISLDPHLRLPISVRARLSLEARTRMGVDGRGRLLPALRQILRPDEPIPDDDLGRGPPSSPTTGTRVGLVLLASFPDRPSDVIIDQAEVDAYCNDPDYTGYDNATSVFGYFDVQSNGRLRYNLLVTAYFTANQNRSYYTDNNIGYGTRARELINEGLAVLLADGFDFTSTDGNSNGVLDGINCFYAGDNTNAWAEGLWPHKSSSSYAGLSGQGVSTSFQYQITNMGSSLRLGTFCHENGHMICGFPDLYSYDGNAANLGGYSLMHSSGSTHPRHVDAYLKIHAGWAEVEDVNAGSHLRGGLEVDRNTFYRFRNPAESREYFLLSMRTNSGYEGVYGGSSSSVNPTDGLVIYHAREHGANTYSSIFSADFPADYTTPFELMVVEANPSSATNPWYNDPAPGGDDGYHAGGVSEASDSTLPALKFWNSSNGRTVTSNMTVHTVSPSGPTMTFVVGSGSVTGPSEISTTVVGLNPSCDFASNAPSQTFAVFNSGAGTLSYTLSDDAPWLSVGPGSGTAINEADIITVIYDTSGLSSNQYAATITVSDPSASNSPQTIPVLLTVHDQSAIGIDQASISINLNSGEIGSSSLMLSNTGGGTLSYSVSSPAAWLDITPTSGTIATEQDTVALSFDASRLLEGGHNTSLTVTSSDASNSPLTVNVTMNVSGHLILVSPNGGEVLYQGSQAEIRWLTDNTVSEDVKIELFKNGVWADSIAVATTNDSLFTWDVPVATALGSDYTVQISDVLAPNPMAESFADFTVTAVPPLVSLPYSESFESGLADWAHALDNNFDWAVNSNGTPSGSTGPNSAYDGNDYIYTEASSPNYPNNRAALEAVFDLRGATAPLLSLYRHMYGATMGTLEIRASSDQSTWKQIFSLSGDQGNVWVPVTADLSSVAGQVVTIQIIGTTGSSYTSDMALDLLTIGEASRVLSYGNDTFSEAFSNDGTISTIVEIVLTGDTFTADVASGGHVTVSRTPPGLSPQLTRDSSTQLTLSLTGVATQHTSADNVLDLEVSFDSGSFSGSDAASVAGNTRLLIVDFTDDSTRIFIDGFESGNQSAWSPMP